MPEIVTVVRWPDGGRQRVYSPSLVVTDHLEEQTAYPLDEFVARMQTALTEASERVRAAYGVPCSRAAASLAAVRARRAGCGSGDVLVEGFER